MLTAIMMAAAIQAAPGYGLTPPAGAQAEPRCAGLRVFVAAWCVSAPRDQGPAVTDALIAQARGQGWILADRGINRAVFVKRRPRGGCDGLQMMTVDQGQAIGRAVIGVSSVPGDLCNGPPRNNTSGAGAPGRPPGG